MPTQAVETVFDVAMGVVLVVLGAALKAATTRLGDKARLTVQGERATVTVSGINGDTLRSFLTEVRGSARARPVEAQLVRNARGYDGTLVLSLGSPQ